MYTYLHVILLSEIVCDVFFFFKQKTAYEMRISDWSSDVCSSDLEEFRPIIGEVLAELKLTLNRREQFALEKVLVDELLGLGPLEELLADPEISDIMVNGPDQTFIERKGKLEIAQIQFRAEIGRAACRERVCQ